MTGLDFEAIQAAEKAKLAELRPRARRFGLFIKSEGWGTYALRTGKDSWPPVTVRCSGADEVESWIAGLERELLPGPKPSAERLDEVIERLDKERIEVRNAAFLASKEPGCHYCGQPSDCTREYRVGPEDVYWWVHACCQEPLREQNRKRHQEWKAASSMRMSGTARCG